ncbi:type I restriction-modification system subunit M N-terminal domain-containing protein [Cyanobacterium sp. IPPAS B-1200]|uniref:type I restriction-modification system subunit M N-terminal domain-containing protein n=1 Tax=Cyanobacterium sp. IPPAS B-1200 TaxID=1562720 RepID=UPI00085261DD|nr:type I restriction-modification system subunit M N-terminal domain-containing protein [Cyanobacterium sp. IPPAS B-1200]OEJ79949.1 hypothetical protein A5482_08125 [Cyanobacterium sp. IPPAS B-1200]
MAIATLIKSIQDIMRKDVGVDGDAQRISQLVWMLFLKIFDDKEQEWEFTIDHYQSPLPERFRWSSWAKNDEGITGDELSKLALLIVGLVLPKPLLIKGLNLLARSI